LGNEAEARRLADEVEAKRLAEETEAGRKEEEQLKQQKIIGIEQIPKHPINSQYRHGEHFTLECTPLNAITDYYYDERTKSIEKRSNKRKRGVSTKSITYTGRVVEWKVGPNP
jgi:hypothetical protein